MEKEKSCGCIIFEGDDVLLIKQVNGNWGFPKGHVEGNETELETAIRETREETNIQVKVNSHKRYIMEYVTDSGNLKQVVYFIASKVGGSVRPQEEEIQEIKWVNFNKALDVITYENTKDLFKEVIKDKVFVCNT